MLGLLVERMEERMVERMEERKVCYSGYRLTFSLFRHFDLQRGFLHWIELIEKDRL